MSAQAAASPQARASSPGGGDLFLTQWWFDNLLANGFVDAVEPMTVRWDTPRGSASLPLMAGSSRGRLSSLSNYYTGLFGPVGGDDPLAMTDWDAVAWQLRQLPSSAVLQMQPLDAASAWLPRFESGLRHRGYWTDRYFSFGNWFQPVPLGGFEVYWAARPSALRNTVARALKRLNKLGDWRLEIVTGPQPGLNAAIDTYVSVYNRSWKVPEPNPAFMPGLIRLAAVQGWLRLGLLWVAGEPVAAQVWLVAGGKANIFKLAYAQGHEKLSTGSVLTAELMRHVMDTDQVREVDFLSGDDAYKADWMDCRRERVGLLAFDQRHWRGWLAASRHILHRYGQRLKQIVSAVVSRR